MTQQSQFTLRPYSRGFHLVTDEIVRNLPPLPKVGLLNLFIQPTSVGLTINENADPDVQTDIGAIFDSLVRECESYYTHTLEGADGMPTHAKSSFVGASLTTPIANSKLNMCIWQGIYLYEFRNRGGGRNIVAAIIG